MKETKKSLIFFKSGSKQPIIFYFFSALCISSLIIIVTLVTGGFRPTLHKEQLKGDVSGNETIDAADALYILMKTSGKTKINGAQFDAGDVNYDGKIDKTDASLILMFADDSVKHLGDISEEKAVLDSPSTGIKNPSVNKKEQSREENEIEENGFLLSGSSDYAAYSTSDKNIYTCAKIVNSWKAEDKFMYQIDVTVKNNSGSYISMSKADIYFTHDVNVEKYWGCYSEVCSDPKEVILDNYGTLNSSKSDTYGIIISSDKEIKIDSVS